MNFLYIREDWSEKSCILMVNEYYNVSSRFKISYYIVCRCYTTNNSSE